MQTFETIVNKLGNTGSDKFQLGERDHLKLSEQAYGQDMQKLYGMVDKLTHEIQDLKDKSNTVAEHNVISTKVPPYEEVSEILKKGDSRFQAFAARVNNSEEAFKFIASVITSKAMTGSSSQHFYSGYITNGKAVDTDEGKGAMTIKNVLNEYNVEHTAVVVTRYFGGTHIGKLRWASVRKTTVNVLSKLGQISKKIIAVG